MRGPLIATAVLLGVLVLTPVALAVEGPTGTYTTHNKYGTFEASFKPAAYSFSIFMNGHYGQIFSGRDSLKGNTITFLAGSAGAGPPDCNGQYAGTYTFTVSGKTLELKLVSDKCANRRTLFGGTFTAVS